MNTNYDLIGKLKLCVQRALLGQITANLAAVFAHFDEKRIVLSAYFFKEATEDDRENFEVTATEVVADYPDGFTIETRYEGLVKLRVDSTLNCVFLRAEASEGHG